MKTNHIKKMDFLKDFETMIKDARMIIEYIYFSEEKQISKDIKSFSYEQNPNQHIAAYSITKKPFFWFPKDESLKQYERALQFLEFALPMIHSMPDFIFSLEYIDTFRSFMSQLDVIFKNEVYKKAN